MEKLVNIATDNNLFFNKKIVQKLMGLQPQRRHVGTFFGDVATFSFLINKTIQLEGYGGD
jgi:dTDP-4-amino-4,6-dideoxygalactose transaminase